VSSLRINVQPEEAAIKDEVIIPLAPLKEQDRNQAVVYGPTQRTGTPEVTQWRSFCLG
jgi:hypothetical protein